VQLRQNYLHEADFFLPSPVVVIAIFFLHFYLFVSAKHCSALRPATISLILSQPIAWWSGSLDPGCNLLDLYATLSLKMEAKSDHIIPNDIAKCQRPPCARPSYL
jgi:hypothetical protein